MLRAVTECSLLCWTVDVAFCLRSGTQYVHRRILLMVSLNILSSSSAVPVLVRYVHRRILYSRSLKIKCSSSTGTLYVHCHILLVPSLTFSPAPVLVCFSIFSQIVLVPVLCGGVVVQLCLLCCLLSKCRDTNAW